MAKVGVANLGVAKKRWQKRGDKKEVVTVARVGKGGGGKAGGGEKEVAEKR